MQGSGYDNSKIGYDPNTSTVTYDNRPFYKGGMNVNGTVFTDQAGFNQANDQYKKTYGPGTVFTSADDALPYDQRLAKYASDPMAARNEYNRATQVSAYNQATGANNADTIAHIQKLQQIMNAQPQNQQPNTDDLVKSIYQRVMNPQAYDVYASPEYAAAKSASDYGAQQATRQAQESLGASGFGRSTNLADRAQGIQQDATQRLMTQIVPQLTAQHNVQSAQQNQDLFNLVNTILAQQGQQFNQNLDQNKFDYTKQLDDRNFGYQQARDAIADDQYKQKFDEDVREFGMNYALDQAVKAHQISNDDAQLAISQQNANSSTLSSKASMKNAKTAAKKADSAQSEQKTPIDAKTSTQNYNDLYDDLQSDQLGELAKQKGMTPKQMARQLLEANSDFLTDSDYKKLNDYINDTF